ncbi:Ribosomal protein S18 acetylase RimI [Parafrankia irregularis]|uniref:Ribosomal protein S18 acetylase RimI n=1 Tax=Parafrankia irregularis TaxID=795642 RepID=A0A0S4QP60_9ACTN|nr:GNAT family N-acetyltransferase [Parafrankia irregularis]MBE3201714.1 GNAT family N-acetyltransferase [Parafrankia sp. CH37]CUU57461.1 Ribosomal protein S18 acetylase RimI [Parafrankia irregularis]
MRRIEAADAERLREIRLAALADAPGSFWQTLAGEGARPFADWQARAARNATGDAHATFLLERAPGLPERAPGLAGPAPGQLVGMVDVHRPSHAPEFRELAAMWVAPAVRGTGAADLLLGAALGWAREVGAVGVRLWVVPTNPAAVGVYLRHGFRPVGTVEEAVPDEAGKVYLPMLLALDDDAAAEPTFLERAQAPWTDESG